MLHNNYYNNYIPYNNMYYRPAPLYPNVETEPIEDSNKSVDAKNTFETINDKKSQEFSDESPLSNRNKISIFGFTLDIDDIIIIGIVIFLFMENKKDYLLLIILGLMFFDISVDTFKNMNIFKQLFNPT